MRFLRPTRLPLLVIATLILVWMWSHRVSNDPGQQRGGTIEQEAVRIPAQPVKPAPMAQEAVKPEGPEKGPPARGAMQFPGSRLLDERTLPADAGGVVVKLKLLETKGQYPLVRVVEKTRGGERLEHYAMVADHVAVRLRDGTQIQQLNEWAKGVGLAIMNQVGDSAYYLVKLPGPDVAEFDTWLRRLENNAALPIEHVQPDYLRFASSVPSDTRFAEQWALHNAGQTGGTPDADVDAPEAWDISRGSASVVVAVIDSGIDLTHPDLISNLWTNPGETPGNGIDDDGNGKVDDMNGWNFVYGNKTPADDEGHGTHCAGVIGASGDNALGVSGICPVVKLMVLKGIAYDGSISESSEAEALAYARTKGAKICSMSFGGPGPISVMERDAVVAALNAGMLLVVAAGNDSKNIDKSPDYPASFNYNNIIAVAATGHGDTRAAFSSYGPVNVDLAAPGVGILSTLLSGSYGYESGSSMSTPLVAGACALLKSTQPTLDYAAIKSAILNACDPVPALKGLVKTSGRLNVARALKIGAGPYVELTKSVIADGKALGALGNSDNIINSGEDITLTITVKNSGPQIATAVITTATITDGSSAVSVIKGSKLWGNIGIGASLTNNTTPFVLRIASGLTAATPFTVHLVHADTAGHTWTNDVNLTVAGTNVLAGRISTLTGDKPMSGAALDYVGPVNGKVTTGKDGRYTVKLPDGTYTLTASIKGYQASLPKVVTIPPNPGDVNFQLGRALMTLTPASIAVTQPEEGITTKQITVTNKGDLPLTFTVENNSLGNAISTAYYTKPAYGDTFRSMAAAPLAPLPYQEGFEGALSLSPARYYEAWTEDDGYYIYYYKIDFFVGSYSIASTTSAVGTKSLYYKEQLGAGFDNGMQKLFPEGTQPRYVSFWVRPGTTAANNGCFSLETGYYEESRKHWTWTPVIDVKAAAGGHFETNPQSGGDSSVPYVAKQWHLVEIRNIDWTTRRYDFWVNGNLVKASIPLAQGTGTEVTRLHLYNEIGEGEAWWDEIRVLNHDEAWLSSTPVQQTLAPGLSTSYRRNNQCQKSAPRRLQSPRGLAQQ